MAHLVYVTGCLTFTMEILPVLGTNPVMFTWIGCAVVLDLTESMFTRFTLPSSIAVKSSSTAATTMFLIQPRKPKSKLDPPV